MSAMDVVQGGAVEGLQVVCVLGLVYRGYTMGPIEVRLVFVSFFPFAKDHETYFWAVCLKDTK